MSSKASLDLKAVNVLKGLIIDAVAKANSGHPGGAMSSADYAYILFKEFLNYDPEDPNFFNRDRFILSAGHESMLLYGLLTFRGLLGIEDLKNFRQFGSKTPGHPEHGVTPGVEVTSGPLGQGFAMGVGMAVAEAMLRARLGDELAGHRTFVLASDGDMQEPICLGSASLAGLWGLDRLVVYYDSNKIQLAGPTNRCDCADYKALFEAMCWRVIEIDGHDHGQIRSALKQATLAEGKPTLIIGHTVMAKGCHSKEGDCGTHGSPLKADEIKFTKEKLGLPQDAFYLPDDVLSDFRSRYPALSEEALLWKRTLEQTLRENPDVAAVWKDVNAAPSKRSFEWPEFDPAKPVATRQAWGKALEALIDQYPLLVGGSADLDPSNQTEGFREKTGIFGPANPIGRSLSFGVREFPMGAILNGMSLHGGLMPFGATFLVFSDYERNALRMSALQKQPVLHVFTHDSFHVGEDGPTHQPIEHTSSLRLIPNLNVFRPADARETCAALEIALSSTDTPSCLLLTRQNLPILPLTQAEVTAGTKKGGYIVREAASGSPEILILASGSEVSLALTAADLLPNRQIRVVSLPSFEIFNQQPQSYRDQILPPSLLKRAAAEAGRGELWRQYVGLDGVILSLDHFGDSAPAGVLAKHYGFTPENLAKLIENSF